MADEQAQIRIGDLLLQSGILTSDYIRNALHNFEQRGLPIGKVLVMSGYLTEAQLRTALEVQSLVNDRLLPLEVGLAVLQIAHKEKIPLAEALQSSGFVQPEDQATNKLGQLLVSANIVTNKELEEALQTNVRTGLPLGHIFCFRGFVSQQLINTALLAQQLIRRGMINREHAIGGMRAAADRERLLEKAEINRGFVRLPMKPTLKIGELFMEAKIISEQALLDALNRSLSIGAFSGQVFIETQIAPPSVVNAAVELQEMLDNSTLAEPYAAEALMLVRKDGTPLYKTVAEVAVFRQRKNKAVDLMEILTSSGQVTLVNVPGEIQERLDLNYNQASDVCKMILKHNLADERAVYGALRCVYLIDEKVITFQKAIMALDFSMRANLTVDEAIFQLGWTQRTRLRVPEVVEVQQH
ncbi:MAG: hypothetical protein JST44_08575 [Cyanobacteria bacterium SZAS LIN-5]|nr:hypothetical protein [Cyanobacteria bacterium SZAS LIN-5]